LKQELLYRYSFLIVFEISPYEGVRLQWWAFVKVVVNHQVSEMLDIS
jgi:hypothetical protein